MVTKRRSYPKGTCESCGKEYLKVRDWQKYCSDYCRLESYKAVSDRQMRDLEQENEMLTQEIKRLRDRVEELEGKG